MSFPPGPARTDPGRDRGGRDRHEQRPRFRDALGLAAAVDGGSFVVDLTGVEYLDSARVHALFAHASRIRLIAGPLLEPMLTVSGLSGITSAGEPQ